MIIQAHGFDVNTYQLAAMRADLAYVQQKAIASNISNKEVPGYKRLKVGDKFHQELQSLWQQGRAQDFKALKPQIVEDAQAAVVRPDGNTVSLEEELMQSSNNQLGFDFAAEVISTSLQQLQIAITGKIN
jgi:flagellar basal-body rod protein FlgB